MNSFLTHLLEEFHLPLSNPVLIFSLILAIILFSPILLRKLNIPGIIGLIISGVIIGPHALNIIEKSSAVDLFSTIGLLYIMFIAGLELDMEEFKANRKKSFIFGFLTFSIPMALGFVVANFFLGYDYNASLLIGSMLATHTLVSYPIVSKLGVSKNQAVAISVGGTIIADTTVLLILAVILGNNSGDIGSDYWITLTVSILIFSAIMFYIIPKVSKWFFAKLESEKHLHYIFVLFIVFFGAFLSEVAGLEPIIGAFFAGLALNRLIPHSSALMSRIEFIGNSLFIPFFLISVGMLVEISAILSGYMALIIAGGLILIALISKWLPAYISQKLFKYTKTQRNLIFGLSTARVAATLAVVLVGYKAGIVGDNILNATIILILVSSIIASIITDKAARKLIIESDAIANEVKSNDKMLEEHILVPIANMQNIEKLMEFSILIKNKKSPNPISLLSVVPNNEEAEQNIMLSKARLEKCVIQASETEVNANIIATIDHNAASGISRTAKEILADIVVIGWPQRSDILDRIVGEKIDGIIKYVDRQLFICQIVKPLINDKRIVIFCPPFCEKEKGFSLWFNKISKLSSELSIGVAIYSNLFTKTNIENYVAKSKLTLNIKYKFFDHWNDFFVITEEIKQDDLIILANSKKGSVSYMSILENLPSKIGKHFEKNNKIIIYPQVYSFDHYNNPYEDMNSIPLSSGIKSISKGIGSIFHKNKD